MESEWKTVVVGTFVVLFVILVAHTARATTFNDTIEINNSQLPLLTHTIRNISLQPNATLIIERMDSDSMLNLSFPNATFYGNDVFRFIRFNISVNGSVTSNKTIIGQLNLSSNVTNHTHLYEIIIHIEYFTPPQEDPVQEEVEDFLTVMNGNYIRNISTNVLPKSGELSYKIAGKEGDTLKVSCPKGWLDCPSKDVKFKSGNVAKFDIDYTIPLDADLGETTYKINLTTGNISKTTRITFNIKEPEISFANYVFGDECYLPVEGKEGTYAISTDCLEQQESYIHELVSQVFGRERAINNYTCECEPEVETEYVIVGDIERITMDDYDQCRTDRNTLNDDLNQCHDDVGDAQNQRDKCLTDLNDNTSVCLANTFQASVDNVNAAEEKKKKIAKAIWTFIFWFVAGVVAIYTTIKFYYAKRKEAWHEG